MFISLALLSAWHCFASDPIINKFAPGTTRSELTTLGFVDKRGIPIKKGAVTSLVVFAPPPTEAVLAVKHFGANKYGEWDTELKACLGKPSLIYDNKEEWLPTNDRRLFVRLEKAPTAEPVNSLKQPVAWKLV